MYLKNLIKRLTTRKAVRTEKLVEAPLLRGEVTVHATDVRTGQVVASHTNHNLLMYNERDILIELLGNIQLGTTDYAQNTAPGAPLTPVGNRRWLKWFAVGEGSTAAARTDLALDTDLLKLEISTYGSAAKSGNALVIEISIPATDGGGDVDTYLNTHTLTEVGLFTIANDESAGTVTGNEVMFSRQVHPGIPKTAFIQIDYTYSIYFT
jgi:hypothetical protein